MRRKQTGLRGFCGTAGTVCLVAFAGQAVSVKSGILNQGERVRDKAKLVLRNW
ncbi:MAG: hypothetical protein ABSA83_13580 [Verrucomicrobiota bacterium]